MIYQVKRGCDILIGTPGKLIELLEKKIISFTNIKYVILDEADKCLDMGFEEPIRTLIQKSDINKEHNTLMFSATYPGATLRLANDFLNNPITITVG